MALGPMFFSLCKANFPAVNDVRLAPPTQGALVSPYLIAPINSSPANLFPPRMSLMSFSYGGRTVRVFRLVIFRKALLPFPTPVERLPIPFSGGFLTASCPWLRPGRRSCPSTRLRVHSSGDTSQLHLVVWSVWHLCICMPTNDTTTGTMQICH
jgi:hypothetical protein